MKKTIWTTGVLAAGVLLLSGCTDITDTIESSSTYSSGSSVGTGSSSVSISQTVDGFVLTWEKPSDGYAEVIYTDDLSLVRGRGYPLTANYAGSYRMPCEITAQDNYEMSLTCSPSNVTYTKHVRLTKGVSYMWLVSEGLDHVHGEVEATMLYDGSSLIIE
jgi:hypothetical protein